MRLILKIETTQLGSMEVWDTETEMLGEKVYSIVGEKRRNGEKNTRFGNKVQTIGILKTYQYSVKREYKDLYKTFMDTFK